MQAIVVAGGLGSRMGALTRRTPKPLLAPPGCGPLLGYIVDALVAVGVSRLVVCVGFGAGAIRGYLDGRFQGIVIDYVVAPPRGVGFAVNQCRRRMQADVPLLLTMADVVCPQGYAPLSQALERVDVALAVSATGPDLDKRYTGARLAADGELAFQCPENGATAGRPVVGVYAIRPVRAFFQILHDRIDAVEQQRTTGTEAVTLGVMNQKGEYRLSFVLQALADAGHTAALVDIGPCAEVNRPHHLARAASLLRSPR